MVVRENYRVRFESLSVPSANCSWLSTACECMLMSNKLETMDNLSASHVLLNGRETKAQPQDRAWMIEMHLCLCVAMNDGEKNASKSIERKL